MAFSSRPSQQHQVPLICRDGELDPRVRVRHREHPSAAALADPEDAQQDAGTVGDVDRQPCDGSGGDAGG